MNISEIFIRRPIGTALLMAGVFIFGLVGYELLPVAALPDVAFPTIVVTANLPGASPEVMADTVATPLEDQFTAIQGLSEMTSTSGLGQTSITLQFDLSRSIDSAAADVQRANFPRIVVRSLPLADGPLSDRRYPCRRCRAGESGAIDI